MSRLRVSDDDARRMYAGGRGNALARSYARFWNRMIGLGLLPRRWVRLEVPGRRSGKVTSFPLGLADVDGRWYLVSMLGECNWTRNVRANDNRAVLVRRRRRPVRLTQVPVAERAPILRRYFDVAPGGRPHIPVQRGADLAEFAAVADRYPVFEVTDDVPGPENRSS